MRCFSWSRTADSPPACDRGLGANPRSATEVALTSNWGLPMMLGYRLCARRTKMDEPKVKILSISMRHRFRNEGTEEVQMVYHLSPLAPRPELGHVDTE